MLKKLLVVGGGVALLLALFFGADACSYVSTSVDWVRQSAKEAIPVEAEINRARNMIEKLGPKINEAQRAIVVEEVQVNRLNDQLQTRDAQLTKSLADIKRLRGDLNRGDSSYVYVGKSYSETQVTTDLEKRFKIYKKQKNTADTLRQTVETRLRGIAEAKAKFGEMQAAKQQLIADVENLQARQNMVKVANASSKLSVDNSHLARTQKLIDDIESRVAVSEEIANSKTNYVGQIQLDGPESGNVLEEIDQYLDEEGPQSSEIALD